MTIPTSPPNDVSHPPVVFAGHNTYLISVARLCREESRFTDVIFHCVDGQVAAHRLVVSAASKFLREILVEHRSEDDDQTVLILPDVTVSSLNILLDFIYSVTILFNTIQQVFDDRSFRILQRLYLCGLKQETLNEC